MALLKLGVIIVDFMMLYIFPKKALYAREKYLRTEDFSEIEKRKMRQEEQKEKKRVRRLRREEMKEKKQSDDEEELYQL